MKEPVEKSVKEFAKKSAKKSGKPTKKRLLALGAAAVVTVTAVWLVPKGSPAPENSLNTAAATADERIAFLEQFGWEVEAEPLEIREVEIPEEFDQVYTRYNQLQQEQGMDLLPYEGRTCKQWIYRVTNYPDPMEEVRAVLLVYEGQVVGGDISSTSLNGFMTGFDGSGGSAEQAAASPAEIGAAEAQPEVSSEVPADAWPVD